MLISEIIEPRNNYDAFKQWQNNWTAQAISNSINAKKINVKEYLCGTDIDELTQIMDRWLLCDPDPDKNYTDEGLL